MRPPLSSAGSLPGCPSRSPRLPRGRTLRRADRSPHSGAPRAWPARRSQVAIFRRLCCLPCAVEMAASAGGISTRLGPVPWTNQRAAAPYQPSRLSSPTTTVSGTPLARRESRSGTNVANAGSSIEKSVAALPKIRSRYAASLDASHDSYASSPAFARMNASTARRGPPSAMASSTIVRRPPRTSSPFGTTASNGGSWMTAWRTTSGWRATRPQAIEAPPLWPTTRAGARPSVRSSAAACATTRPRRRRHR